MIQGHVAPRVLAWCRPQHVPRPRGGNSGGKGLPLQGRMARCQAKLGANACASSAFTHLSVPQCPHLCHQDVGLHVSEPCCAVNDFMSARRPALYPARPNFTRVRWGLASYRQGRDWGRAGTGTRQGLGQGRRGAQGAKRKETSLSEGYRCRLGTCE